MTLSPDETGRRFIVSCDGCGATIKGDGLVTALDAATNAGWAVASIEASTYDDLCPHCEGRDE